MEDESAKLGRFRKKMSTGRPMGMPYKIVAEKIDSLATLSALLTKEGEMTRDREESVDVLMGSLLPSNSIQEEPEEQKKIRSDMIEIYNSGGWACDLKK